MKELSDVLMAIAPFSPALLEGILQGFTERRLLKYEYYAQEGEYCSRIALLNQGVMRAFYRNREGSEYNKIFFMENSLVAGYASLISGRVNAINIQCLTDCLVWEADYNIIRRMGGTYPVVESFFRVLAESLYLKKEKKQIEQVMMSGAERYESFQIEFPELEKRIPQYHIASYLGITPTQLSRIRARR